MALVRAMWSLAFDREKSSKKSHKGTADYRVIDQSRLLEQLSPLPPEAPLRLLESLQELGLYWTRDNGEHCIHLSALQPLAPVRRLLHGAKPDHELRYFVMRNIQRHYGCNLSSETVHLFHLLASALNSPRGSITDGGGAPNQRRESTHIWNYTDEFLPWLRSSLAGHYAPEQAQRHIDLFIEMCRALDYVRAHYQVKRINLRTSNIDAEFLLANLFGMPTSIKGFDELFGGGGLILAGDPAAPGESHLGGRTVLIRGRSGTGKSLLSMQLAVQVARLGGAAWLMPLEQTAEECLYSLKSVRAFPDDGSVVVATDVASASAALSQRNGNQGVLIILKTVKDSFTDFLQIFAENAAFMKNYPLRLISVDPVNSITVEGLGPQSRTDLRAQTIRMIDRVEHSGTNIMLVAEENETNGTSHSSDLQFEENIADTVIRLSVKKRRDYAQRYFEITKSRFQREQTGEHPFEISPGTGFTIYPSSAAIISKIQPRSLRPPDTSIRFGLQPLDDILGEKGIAGGDVIAFKGPGGSFKTPLGLYFLLDTERVSSDQSPKLREQQYRRQRKPVSLLVAARDNEATIRHILREHFRFRRHRPPKGPDDIIIIPLPHGHVSPGYIIQRIEDVFLRARLNGYWIDRVMVDNIAHWEMSCPFLRDDDTFGDMLVEFLRRQRVTSLLVCGDTLRDSRSDLQHSIIDAADCVLQFDQIVFRGQHRMTLRVLKTRGMHHRRESFDLTPGPEGIEIKPSSSLLRIERNGKVAPVKISLFLHSETLMQREYNDRFLKGVRAVLSPNATIESQDRIYLSRSTGLAASSATDELQIMQLDEMQLPKSFVEDPANLSLYTFPSSEWDEGGWSDFVPRMVKKIRPTGESFLAVPFYENISLLAYRKDLLEPEATVSFTALLRRAQEWEAEHPNEDEVFFDFPQVTTENYACLFWEILHSLRGLPKRSGSCMLRNWTQLPEAAQAAKIFRGLCRRSYFASGSSNQIMPKPQTTMDLIHVNPNAVVWRHWYTTLNQMMSDMDPPKRAQIKVCALPQEVVMAGEWYLALPSYSAAPEVGIEIIKSLTSPEAELDRLRYGVGLPTHSTFYETEALSPDEVETAVSPYFSLNNKVLKRLVEKAFMRSDFGCYSAVSGLLAYYLQRIIEIPDAPGDSVEARIRDCFRAFDHKLNFMNPNKRCTHCSI